MTLALIAWWDSVVVTRKSSGIERSWSFSPNVFSGNPAREWLLMLWERRENGRREEFWDSSGNTKSPADCAPVPESVMKELRRRTKNRKTVAWADR